MTETTEKKEIVPTLRKMAVGECEVFPLSQARSIGRTIYGANLAVERANGYKCSAKTNIEKKTVTVTRTQSYDFSMQQQGKDNYAYGQYR